MRLLPSCFLNKFRNAPLLAYFRVVAAVRACFPHPDCPLLSPECERVSASVRPSCLPRCLAPPPVHSRPTPRDFVVAPLLTPRLFPENSPLPSAFLAKWSVRAPRGWSIKAPTDPDTPSVHSLLSFVVVVSRLLLLPLHMIPTCFSSSPSSTSDYRLAKDVS
jgi:hypothetical protein